MGVNRIDMSLMREMEDRDFYHLFYVLKGMGKYKSRDDGIAQLMEFAGDKAASPLTAYLSAYSRYRLLMQ
jgi:hypothetical protein